MFRHGFALVEAAYPGSTWLQDSFPEMIYRTEGIYPSERQKKQRERGIELVELAAKKGHADALYWLGLKGARALPELGQVGGVCAGTRRNANPGTK